MGEKRGRKNETQRLDELRGDQIWQRLVEDAELLGFDRRIRTQIGRLAVRKQLAAPQASAGELIGRIYGEYERLHGKKRSCKSQSYEFTTAGEQELFVKVDGELVRSGDAKFDEWAATVDENMRGVQSIIEDGRNVSEVRDAIEALCVEDRAISAYQVRLITPVLWQVAALWGYLDEDAAAPPMVPKLPRTLSKPRIPGPVGPPRRKKLTRTEKLDKGHYAARTDDAKPGRPSTLTGPAKAAAARDREGLMRTLLKRQALREGAET